MDRLLEHYRRYYWAANGILVLAIAYTLADLRQVKVSFGVPDVALRRFPVGSTVQVNVDALPGQHYIGRVIGVSPAADAATRLFRVQAVAPNPGAHLKAGMVASRGMFSGTRPR